MPRNLIYLSILVFLVISLISISRINLPFLSDKIKLTQSALQLSAKKDPLTELYFENPGGIGANYLPGGTDSYAFVIHNLENRPVRYDWEVTTRESETENVDSPYPPEVPSPTGGGVGQNTADREKVIAKGQVDLPQDAKTKITRELTPDSQTIRTMVAVKIRKKDPDSPSVFQPLEESIHFWTAP